MLEIIYDGPDGVMVEQSPEESGIYPFGKITGLLIIKDDFRHNSKNNFCAETIRKRNQGNQ